MTDSAAEQWRDMREQFARLADEEVAPGLDPYIYLFENSLRLRVLKNLISSCQIACCRHESMMQVAELWWFTYHCSALHHLKNH